MTLTVSNRQTLLSLNFINYLSEIALLPELKYDDEIDTRFLMDRQGTQRDVLLKTAL